MYQLKLYEDVIISDDPSLAGCRKAIDEIDLTLYDLFIKRIKVSDKVSTIKALQNGSRSFFRIFREVEVIKNAYNGLKGYYPKAFCVHIWRLFISALLSNERTFTIASENDRCYWMSREYFGSFVENHIFDDGNSVIDSLLLKKHDTGCLKFPSKHTKNGLSTKFVSEQQVLEAHKMKGHNKWWLKLINSQLKIFAIYPFVKEDNNPSVLFVANIDSEATGDDTALIVVKTKSNADCIISSMAEINIFATLIDLHESYQLFSINCFIDGNSIIKISEKLDGAKVYTIGAFANPI